jgi:hypothetical protein
MTTVQRALDPAANVVERQVSADTIGAGHSVKEAACDDPPSAALMEAVARASILPAVTLKAVVELPAGTVTLVGTVMALDVVLTLRTVLDAAACDSSAVHELVASAMTPLGLQSSAVTRTAILRVMVADCPEPL